MRSIVFAIVLNMCIASVVAAADDSAAKGAQVFVAQKCSLCHSIAGKGNPKGTLDSVGTKLKADEIRMWLTDAPAMAEKTKAARKPAMKKYALAQDDVDALVAYLSSLKK